MESKRSNNWKRGSQRVAPKSEHGQARTLTAKERGDAINEHHKRKAAKFAARRQLDAKARAAYPQRQVLDPDRLITGESGMGRALRVAKERPLVLVVDSPVDDDDQDWTAEDIAAAEAADLKHVAEIERTRALTAALNEIIKL
jgi:hypothetical protein